MGRSGGAPERSYCAYARTKTDAVRQPCAVLLTRPTYGTCLARPLSTLDVGPGKSEARLCSRSDFPGPAAGLERNRAQHVPQDGADAFRGKTSAPGHLRLDLLRRVHRHGTFPEKVFIVFSKLSSDKLEYIPIKLFTSGLFLNSSILIGIGKVSVLAFLILFII